jgi:hypothetical protein
VTVRHTVLGIVAVATLGLGVYLFLAVNSAPAASAVPGPVEHHVDKPAQVAQAREEAPSTPSRSAHVDTPAHVAVKPVQTAEAPAPPAIEVKKEDMMTQANKAYDAGDLDEAMSIARKVLETDPQNVRMRRVMVSSSCILGDAAIAQKHYLFLPPPDRETMRIRCARYGVTFTES